MVISESGVSRQVELTSFRLRVAGVVVVGIAAAVVAVFFAARPAAPVDRSVIAERDTLAGKVRALEEKVQKQELELTVRENRLEEMEASLARAATDSPGARDMATQSPRPRGSGRAGTEGPLTSIAEGDEPTGTGPSQPERGGEPADRGLASREGARAAEQPSSLAARAERDAAEQEVTVPSMTFDAQDVTAVAEGPNKGKLSFRLVKDQPKVRFSGYLFVFVEMVDKRGEGKIYAYPKRTRLGDGYLPQDYRAGESLAFKFNSRVELPYTDSRSTASLSLVTIILYNEDGSIVFQRGFDRKDLKLVSAHATKAEGVQPPPPQPTKKRQAL